MDNLAVDQIPYIVLDFETVTQAGSPPEPIELGAMRINPPGQIDPDFEVGWFIRLPGHMPTAIMDHRAEFHGINFQSQPSAQEVFRRFDSVCGSAPFVAVAHNANYDASFILRYAESCPHLASMPFIDTVKLSRHLLPGLSSYRLDSVAEYFKLAIPFDRHRALPDVRLTCEIFIRLIRLWQAEHQDQRFFLLKKVAGIRTTPNPVQPSLFG
ncbi:MAG: 3'-5' exonuclease [Chloroflexota bacterium]